jgi:hypothetical protein
VVLGKPRDRSALICALGWSKGARSPQTYPHLWRITALSFATGLP